MKKYRPSNGTEGLAFQENWCCNCARDRVMNGEVDIAHAHDEDLCYILGDTAFPIDDPRYPAEWIYKGNVPTCTAFVPVGQEIPPVKCDYTSDMFGG